MRKIVKIFPFFFFFLIYTFLYFKYNMVFFPDSTGYYVNSKILINQIDWGNWFLVRGFSFPLLIGICIKLFGDSLSGLLIGSYIVNIIFLLLVLFILNYFLKKNDCKNKFIYYVCYFFFFTFNVLIIGYSHTLLTESIMPLINLLGVYICFYWSKKAGCFNTFSNSFCSIIIIFFTPFIWFIKQPYVPAFCGIVVLSSIISGIYFKSFKVFLKKFGVFIFSVVFLISSIFLWDNFISTKVSSTKELTSSYMSDAVLSGIEVFYYNISKDDFCSDSYLNTYKEYISTYDKVISFKNNHPTTWCDYLKVYEIHNKYDEYVSTEVFFSAKTVSSTKEELIFLFKQILTNPKFVFGSYFYNYLAISDLQGRDFTYGYRSNLEFSRYAVGENGSNGMSTFNIDGSSVLFEDSYNKHLITDIKKDNKKLTELLYLLYEPDMFLYRLSMIIVFPLLICGLFYFFKYKNEESIIIVIMCFMCVCDAFFHVFCGAIIDRYVYSYTPLVLLSLLIICSFDKNKKISNKKNGVFNESLSNNISIMKEVKVMKSKNDKNKILFVIPAYNEAENIEKVLNEIKKDVNYADILVINDCSKDNTEEVLKKNGVNYLNNVYNMKYAMTVQTGIKYAYENDYDYVISMDADGQHIASEAKKMYEFMLKEKCDIVIGSRYMKDMGYKCPTFRRIGTKIFEIMIRIFCKKRIYDPLSGFQCINKKVIKEYAQMGGYPEFPDANLIVEMLYKGYDIKEIPVKMRNRESGESMHGGIIKPIKYMVNIAYTICFIVIQNIGRRK